MECPKGMSPEQHEKILEAVKTSELQKSIDEMLETGQFEQYVRQAKLELVLGSEGKMLDGLLKLGYLEGYKGCGF